MAAIRRTGALIWVSLGMTLACSSTTQSSRDGECAAGDLRRCICPDNTVSNMVCGEDRSYGDCECGSGDGGAANGGAGDEGGGTSTPTGGAGEGGLPPLGGTSNGGSADLGTGGTGGAPTGGAPTGATGGDSVGGGAGTASMGGASSGATGGDSDGGMAGSSAGGVSSGGITGAGGASEDTGGVQDTGGVATGGESTGGVQDTGGVATGGESTGGVSTGGVSTGGESTGGVSTGGESTGGVSTGGTAGGCVTGQTQGDEVVFIGESFIAVSTIPETIEARAVAAGSLAAGEQYLDNSVSGAALATGQISAQYANAQASHDIRFVIMDGGATDCMSENSDGALSAAESLFETMAQDGVEAVLYFFYADYVGQYDLKTCLDGLRPQMQALCEGLTSPPCYWVDLRPTWEGHPEYTSDGVHPTQEGSTVTGNLIWEAMVEHCIAQ